MMQRESLDVSERIRIDATAGGIAVLTRALVKCGYVTSRHEADVMRYVIRHFTSKKTDKMAFPTFKTNYKQPQPADIDDAIRMLHVMIAHLKKL
jgi:hypothetical protein